MTWKRWLVAATLALLTVAHARPAIAAPAGHFGYLLPSVRNVQLPEIPRRDRYVKAIAEHLAAATSLTIVALPAHAPSGLDLQALCTSMGLVGVIDPYVGWNADSDSVSVQATAVVMDCNGKQFYLGKGSDVAARNAAIPEETQVDAQMAVATERLAQRFSDFTKVNAGSWNALRNGAAAAPLSPEAAAAAPVQAFERCASYFAAHQYVGAIAACNDAGVAKNVAPGLKTMMQRTPEGSDTRSFVSSIGLMTATAYCIQAESHYQLAEPAAGLAQATECTSWIRKLDAYIKRSDPHETDRQLQATARQLAAFGDIVKTQYPEITTAEASAQPVPAEVLIANHYIESATSYRMTTTIGTGSTSVDFIRPDRDLVDMHPQKIIRIGNTVWAQVPPALAWRLIGNAGPGKFATIADIGLPANPVVRREADASDGGSPAHVYAVQYSGLPYPLHWYVRIADGHLHKIVGPSQTPGVDQIIVVDHYDDVAPINPPSVP